VSARSGRLMAIKGGFWEDREVSIGFWTVKVRWLCDFLHSEIIEQAWRNAGVSEQATLGYSYRREKGSLRPFQVEKG